MRAITAFCLLEFGVSALFFLVLVGCPPSFYNPCRGAACDDALDGGPDAPAPADTNPPTLTSVSIEGNPTRTIRQGFGGAPTNGETVVHLTGEHLGTVTDVTVGLAPNVLHGLITSATSTELVFTVAIGHGAPIGRQGVKVTAPSGSATLSEAILITAITAAPDGNDANDVGVDTTGTDGHPFRSLAKATLLAGAGDTISLKNGHYDVAHGETFSQIIGTSPYTFTPNVPADVTIQGESTGGTFLDGPGSQECSTGAGAALTLAGNAHIEGVGLSGFCFTGIITTSGTVTIDAVTVHDIDRYGVTVSPNVTLDLDSVEIYKTSIGIFSHYNTVLTMTDSHLHNNSYRGIDASTGAPSGTLMVTNTEIDHNGSGDPDTSAGIVAAGATTLTNVKIHDNNPVGLMIPPSGSTGPIMITNSTFSTNAATGLSLQGPGTVTVRSTTFAADPREIYLSGESFGIDLGIAGSTAANTFKVCATCDGIFDDRPAASKTTQPIIVTGSSFFHGSFPSTLQPGCSNTDNPKTATEPPRFWHITNPGTCPPIGNVVVN